jgi:F420-dependent oxidoreductase-like protein
MRIGLQVPNYTWPNGREHLGDTFGQIAERAERAGLYSLWVMDHFFQLPDLGPAENEMLEGWNALSFAAGRTNRIKLGTLVTGVTYRYPGLLVKIATTLDVLSHGRAYFGIGAAWNEEEHLGLGVPFPPLTLRFELLEEVLQIALQMWSGEDKPYEGKHLRLARPLNVPNSVQRPHPPILVGGAGEQKTLRLVAQYADACNLFARIGKKALQHKLDVLRRHCEEFGRPFEEIEKTTLSVMHLTRHGRNGTMSPAAAIDALGELAEIGIGHAILILPNVSELEPFELLATQILPHVSKIPIGGH